MNPDRLRGIRDRLAATTPGHWVASCDLDDDHFWDPADVMVVDSLPVPTYRGDRAATETERLAGWADKHVRGVVASTHNSASVPVAEHDANQAFIAHAPADILYLLDLADGLIAVLIDLERELP